MNRDGGVISNTVGLELSLFNFLQKRWFKKRKNSTSVINHRQDHAPVSMQFSAIESLVDFEEISFKMRLQRTVIRMFLMTAAKKQER